MLNFTVGPVQASDEVCQIGAEQVPYFRTPEFSELMLENESLMKKFAGAPESSRVVFITGSGTAAMEAAVIGTLNEMDKVLVVNGGSFGQRFVQLCEMHGVSYSELKLEAGKTLTAAMLSEYDGKNYTAFLVNVHETSTGVYYDMDLIHNFCNKNNMLLIVDAISSFLADEFDMEKMGVDVMITGSQKALACPPGISILVIAPKALERIKNSVSRCMYLDLKSALDNAKRGQTPFTPAVGILRQINARLKAINVDGVGKETEKIACLAEDFRARIRTLPFEIFSESLSNAVTPLHPMTASAYDIFRILKDEYDIWVCPNGGALKDEVFRVGHIGNLTIDDNTVLIDALKDMQNRGII